MATTTNYGWTTPDDTALVKDGASAIRTLGTSVDTTTKNLNPETTLGDISFRSSTLNVNTRLGIGSSGQALTVVAGAPSWAASPTSVLTTTGDTLYASAANTLARLGIGSTGQILTVSGGLPSWAAAPAAGANWSLLNSGGTALTAASTITVSGISSADKIMVIVSGASATGSNSFLTLRLNADSGSNYNSFGNFIVANSTYATSQFEGYRSASDTVIPLARLGAVNTSIAHSYTLLTGCNSSGNKMFTAAGGATPDGGFEQRTLTLGGFYTGSSTISSISIVNSSAQNWDAGTVFVYTSA